MIVIRKKKIQKRKIKMGKRGVRRTALRNNSNLLLVIKRVRILKLIPKMHHNNNYRRVVRKNNNKTKKMITIMIQMMKIKKIKKLN